MGRGDTGRRPVSISISVRSLFSSDTRATGAPQVHKRNLGLVCGVLLHLVYMREFIGVSLVIKIICFRHTIL